MMRTNFFLNLEKKGIQNRIRKLTVAEKEISDHKEISNNIKMFYETLIKHNFSKNKIERQEYLNYLSTKTLINEQSDLCGKKYKKLIYSIP